MKLQGRIPVEQLEDERLTNIERKLVVAVSEMQAPPERAPRRALVFAGMAMAVALAGVVGWKLHRPGAPVVAKEQPQAFALRSDGDGSTLDLGDARVTSSAGTEARVERTAQLTDLKMAHGKLSLDVEHKPGRTLVVHAGETDIVDVGTKFTVDYDGKNHVEVRVTEGEVKVSHAGKDVAVTASNAWTTELGAVSIAKLDETLAAGAVIAANDNQMPPDQVEPVATGSDASTRGSDARGSDARGTEMRGSDARGSANVGTGSGAGSGSTHTAGATNIRKAIIKIGLKPLPGTMADYNERLRTAQGDDAKQRVMYSIAVTQHLQKNDTGALHSIEGIVYGRTKLEAYKDAMWLQVRITCLRALDDKTDENKVDKCRSAAQDYLNNIPDGTQAGIASEILKAIVAGL
jgi:hypothetical protein